jgi:TRAP transporter TAXI family solute receptor
MDPVILSIVLGTATPGGGFPVFGAAFTDMVNAQEPRIRIEARPTKGSAENVPLLEADKVDIALVAGDYAETALGKPGATLRIITAMYGSPGMFVVRGDSPVKTIADLKGQPVALGTQGSGITVLGRTVLKSLDLPVKEITLEKAADGPPMVLDGRAAALFGAGIGWPGFESLGKAGGRYIVPTAAEIQQILAKNPGIKPMAFPAGSYPGQSAALQSVGQWSFVLARPGLSEEAGYLLARAIHRAEGPMASRLTQARETTMANTVAAAPRADLIHPGVRKYLREIGLARQ